MKAMGDTTRRTSPLKKWGPLAALMSVGVVVVGLLVTTSPTASAPQRSTTPAGVAAPVGAQGGRISRPGVVSFSAAKKAGTVDQIKWGDRCDTTKGVLKMPLAPPPECFAPFSGDNGGSTTQGVTKDTIKVVVWVSQDNDPILSFVYRQISSKDTGSTDFLTYQSYLKLIETYYETYGRKVELVRWTATGPINDPVSAAADAETIARDIKPFAVLGGPSFTGAFGETMVKNKILCISCGGGDTNKYWTDNAPYAFAIMKNYEQNAQQTIEYVGKRVANRPAAHAGEGLKGKPRRLGIVYVTGALGTADTYGVFSQQLKERYGAEFVEKASYTDPVSLAGQAREIIARFKGAGVTTILFAGDPLAPQTLTENAQQQDYHPEWIITGAALVDTNIFGRTYQQEQWSRAFGPSNLFARALPSVFGPQYLHKWFFGRPPASPTNAPLILPNLQLLMGVIQGMGPQVTAQDFQDVIFNTPIYPGTPIAAQISWGDRGVWPETDFTGLDDQTEVWWDPAAVGPDESGTVAKGMWAYVDGGRRFLPGKWPKSAPDVFDPKGAVTVYRELPPGITLPDYPPIPAKN